MREIRADSSADFTNRKRGARRRRSRAQPHRLSSKFAFEIPVLFQQSPAQSRRSDHAFSSSSADRHPIHPILPFFCRNSTPARVNHVHKRRCRAAGSRRPRSCARMSRSSSTASWRSCRTSKYARVVERAIERRLRGDERTRSRGDRVHRMEHAIDWGWREEAKGRKRATRRDYGERVRRGRGRGRGKEGNGRSNGVCATMNGRDLGEIVFIERWKPGSGANGERKQREEKDAEEKTRSARRQEDEEGDGRSNDVCATMNGRDLVEIDFIERWKPGSGANAERKQKETRTRRRSCAFRAVTRESEGNGRSNGVCAAMNGRYLECSERDLARSLESN